MKSATAKIARTYRIPDTRLPFVNGEIAEVMFQGKPHLVSAAWCGNAAGGKLFFWDPETGKAHRRPLPPGCPGAYMLKTGQDGKLYIGGGEGDLYRYLPAADRCETLVEGVMHSITWGGCVTERHVVWAASPGDAAVYDLKESKLVKVFSPLDVMEPRAMYAHTVIAAPDGKAICFGNVPQTRIIEVDPVAGTARSLRPPEMVGAAWTPQAAFVDAKTIVALVATDPPVTLLIEYPSLKVIGKVAVPETPIGHNQRACLIGGKMYTQFGPGASLYRFDVASRRWELVAADWGKEGGGYMGVWGGHTAVAIRSDGQVEYWDSRTGKTRFQKIEAWGPLEAHALCVAPEMNVIVGAPFINSRFWTIDLATGEGRDRGIAQPGGGQVNQVVWDAGRKKMLIASYTQAALTEFDPTQGGSWPENPRLVAGARDEGQMRPKALEFDGRYAWMATSPIYGTLGGALVRFDPQSNEKRVWRNIVPEQTINALVLDTQRKRVYCSSEVWADCDSCPPTQKTAQVVAFDMQSLEVIGRREIRAEEPWLNVLCLLPGGGVLVNGAGKLWRWELEGDVLRELGETPPGLQQVVADEDGTFWAVARGGIGRLTLDGKVQFELVIPEEQRILLLQIVDGMMYYPAGVEVHAVPMDRLRKR